jgi:MOSC domain-containing protein YiiM
MAAGRLGGIARHDRPRGPVETLDRVSVTATDGVHGCFRSAAASARPARRRQVSLLEAESWAAALEDLGIAEVNRPAWHARRANLLVEGLRLPREAGRVVAIGTTLRIETVLETEPCERMDDLLPGLRTALARDWRGGVCGRVLTDGEIAIGDEVRIEE